MQKVFWVVVVAALFSSCVPNKRLVIVQDKNQKRPQDQEYLHQFNRSTSSCLLQPGDVVSVQIEYLDLFDKNFQRQSGNESSARLSNPLTEGFTISADGKIDLPLIGEIEIQGVNLDSARNIIKVAALKVYSKPAVKINMLNTEVTVLGEVMHPGTYGTHRCGNPVFESLGLAGGVTTMADLRSVKIIRDRGDSTQVYFLDLSNEDLLSQSLYYTMPGDIIYVKPLKRKMLTFQESQQVFRGLGVVLSVASLLVAISRL
jgi:polysaccharide export outer membrane protein